MLSVSIKDNSTAGLEGIVRAITKGLVDKAKLNEAVGRRCSELTKEHLYGLANSRHRPHVGLNFYEDAGDSVSHADLGDSVEIRIDKTGVAQRFYGGDIEPVNVNHLWIPVEGSPAEGKAPGEFWPYDSIVFSKDGNGQGFAWKDLGSGEELLFWLVSHVHQDPDPSVLPSADAYAEAAAGAMDLVIDRAIEKVDLQGQMKG